MILYFATRSELLAMNCLLGYRLLRPLGTTQRYIRVMAAVFPFILSAILLCLLLRLCYGEFPKLSTHSFDLRDPWLIDCMIERFGRISVNEHSMLSCFVYSLEWSSGQSLPAPILWLHVYFSFCCFLFSFYRL